MPTKYFTQPEIDQENKKYKTCLVILFGVVYNMYRFAQFDHPGGENILIKNAGEILDDIVQDGMHQFTADDIQKKFAQYQVGFFRDVTVSTGGEHSTEIDVVERTETVFRA